MPPGWSLVVGFVRGWLAGRRAWLPVRGLCPAWTTARNRGSLRCFKRCATGSPWRRRPPRPSSIRARRCSAVDSASGVGPSRTATPRHARAYAAHLTVPVPTDALPTVPVTYDGTTFDPFSSGPVGGGDGDRGTNAAGGMPAKSRHLVAGLRVAGTAAAKRRPRFVIPRDDVAVAIEADALVDDKGEPEIVVHHLVFARKLHTHGTARTLRHQCRIEGHGVGAVDAVAPGAACYRSPSLARASCRAASRSCRAWG